MSQIGFISLGCPKALVDSEDIITQLKLSGYGIVNDYQKADLVIVNTCGFIDSAIAESLSTIGEALDKNGKVIVTGCLGAKDNLIIEKYPQILGITGPHATNEVLALVQKNLPLPMRVMADNEMPATGIKLTPKHYAYLKISEGCNNSCSFCIIPQMRGKLNSYPIDNVLKQAANLVQAGTKELLIISQDTSAYGVDIKYRTGFYGGRPIKTKLLDLCQELGKFGVWIRLHYVYPYPHVDDIIPLMSQGLILPYLDIPFQHASPRILKLMKRPGKIEHILQRIQNWRQICPELVIRSTFIVGFPSETDEDFQMLLDFLTVAQLDKVGCFQYSAVAGATANNLLDHVSEEVKQQRYEQLMKHQLQISQTKLAAKVGSVITVIIDQINQQHLIGRSKADAPEIDGLVYIKNNRTHKVYVGDMIDVKVTDSNEYDLFARLI